MSDPKSDPTPEWVERILDALSQAQVHGYGDDKLTRTERNLLDAAFILLRGRFGLSALDDPNVTAAFLIERSLIALRGDGRS